MQKIDKLTQEQMDLFPVYVKRYTDIGLNTDRIDEEQCKNDINKIQVNILKRKATDVIVCDNPKICWERVCKYVNPNSETLNFVSPYFQGSFDANIFAFYDYMKNEVGVKFEPKIEKLYSIPEVKNNTNEKEPQLSENEADDLPF